MKRIILILLLLIVIAYAEPADIVQEINLEGKQALIFSAELNLSNGNPYTRDYGERGMFGKLVMAETLDVDEYICRADSIFSEAKRLMLGPWKNGGRTEMTYCTVGRGVKLDLDTGKWIRSGGGDAIRIVHTTEYMNSIRAAYILLDGLTLWRGLRD